ncbi:class I SAM-dependent methyltransferase [Candidatus Nitronereus thalassa]|uniref:Class I SAM-dependent methyltransferase n=1 Tax=Candidatus Nitronereus thalassa TaxID=3020898 RepID=A0ABU3K3D7_9BACT|nr:class I SAM-dependent methyltransferase [Candidatus Nitronereus thalassa]MDT7040886.1 class I SAM-dependent methyltransferase [Candidatus Nitronereus thalassa]
MKNLIAPEIDAYAEAHSTQESDVCRRLREETYRSVELPQMVVGPLEGAFLKMMTQVVSAKRVLEIGTFTGYSALCFAEALPAEGQVITCDIDPETSEFAQKFWDQSTMGRKIHAHVAPALETMKQLSGHFDVIFIDADKINYVNYYQRGLELLAATGIMLIDNVLWNGDVILHPPLDNSTGAIQELNRVVAADPRVTSVLVTIRDGVLVVRRAG